jgi:hypothetical protein
MWLPASVHQKAWPWMRGLGRIVHASIPGPFLGNTILSASDYSGTHTKSRFTVYSFLFVDAQYSPAWPAAREQVRKTHLTDGRRMEFKSLNDRQRSEALPCFLNAADSLCGLLCTIAVDKSYTRMATSPNSGTVWAQKVGLKGRWEGRAFEEMSRVVLLWSFILSHLARGFQAVTWITDQDEIAANDDRLTDLLEMAGRLSSSFLREPMLELAVNTTAIDDGSRGFEDFVAIPDLAAGAFAEVAGKWTEQPGDESASSQGCVIPNLSSKAEYITDWLASQGGPLRKVAVLVRTLRDGRRIIHRVTSMSDDLRTFT